MVAWMSRGRNTDLEINQIEVRSSGGRAIGQGGRLPPQDFKIRGNAP